MSDFYVEYLCLLDPGCLPPGRGHSLHCEDLNEKRTKALYARERKRRLEQVTAEIGEYGGRQ